MMEYLLYLVAGAIAGMLSGLFGVGGGLIIVPILVFIFTGLDFNPAHIMHMALGTSLATIALNSVSSARAHHRKHNVNWQLVRDISPGVIFGTLLGTALAATLDSSKLQIIFVLFVFMVATQFLFDLKTCPHRQLPGKVATSIIGALIGALSSLVGIGGGTLSIPFQIYCNSSTHYAIGTSAAIGISIAFAGFIGYAWQGWGIAHLPPYSLGFVYLPAFLGIVLAGAVTAPLGAHLAHTFSAKTLKRLLALLLYLIGIKMIFGLI